MAELTVEEVCIVLDALALLEECLVNGYESDAALVAWFHGEAEFIQQTVSGLRQTWVADDDTCRPAPIVGNERAGVVCVEE